MTSRATALAAVLACLLLAPSALAGDRIVVLTNDDKLVTVDSAAPVVGTAPVPVTGLQPGEHLQAIDVRPLTGKLYGLGSSSRLYTINRETGAAQPVGLPFAQPLEGAFFGFDFDPDTDQIRVVSSADQNFRVNPTLGTVTPDTDLNPSSLVVALGYDRNFPGSGSRTAYGINSATNQLVRVGGADGTPSANGGAVTAIGALGVDTSANVGLDETTMSGRMYASLQVAGEYGLYTVSIGSGDATLVDDFPPGIQVRDIAVPAGGREIYTVDGSYLYPMSVPGGGSPAIEITGLLAGETIRGLDVRPSNGQLYVLGSSRLYRLNRVTGVASPVSAGALPGIAGSMFGFEFSPADDRIRVVSDAEANVRLDPDTAAVTSGTALSPAGQVTDLAHVDNGPGTPQSTLVGVDSDAGNLVRIGGVGGVPTPNGGQVTTIGPLNVFPDIAEGGGLDSTPDGLLLGALYRGTPGEDTRLYWIDSVTGRALSVAYIAGDEIDGMAFAPSGRLFLGASAAPVAEAAGKVTVNVARVAGSANTVTVEAATSGGSATAGADYTRRAMVVKFAPGETQKSFEIPIADDQLDEPDETITLTLSDATSGATVGEAARTITIADDDAAPEGGETPPAEGQKPVVGTPPSGNVAPVLSRVGLTNRTFAPLRAPAPRRARRGTRFRFSLSEAARVDIVLQRAAKGRRVGRSCRPDTRRLRRRPACTRWVRVGAIRIAGRPGANSVSFSGRLGRRALVAGRYRALARATDPQRAASAQRSVGFRVVGR